MKIVVFGANGKTGILLIEQALAKGYEVTAYVRRLGALSKQHPKLNIVTGELSDTGKLKDVISGSDACISALGGGSLTKHSPAVIKGIENIIQAMEFSGANRFIYLSSIGVGESRYFMPAFMRFLLLDILLRVPMADHYTNERRIAASNLNWTVIRPAGLTDGPKTGNVNYGSENIMLKGNPKISRANVAALMLEQVADSRYIKKAVWLYE